MPTHWLEDAINALANQFPDGSFLNYPMNIMGLVAVVLVGLICGGVGSLVVGNRMAFFSDALAHCTFAGVTLGLLMGLGLGAQKDGPFYQWGVPAIMVGFGIAVGVAIAFVREQTRLASDTVIGVFFAGAIGLGGMLLGPLRARGYINPEQFLFGSLVAVQASDLLILFALAVVAALVLLWKYNELVLASLHPSLARSRRVPVRFCGYLFIILLALIVNLCLKIVGALLINALLLVPVATACNLSNNLRRLFWTTSALCLGVGLGGQVLCWELGTVGVEGIGVGGSIVVLAVLLFFVSMMVPSLRAWADRQRLGGT